VADTLAIDGSNVLIDGATIEFAPTIDDVRVAAQTAALALLPAGLSVYGQAAFIPLFAATESVAAQTAALALLPAGLSVYSQAAALVVWPHAPRRRSGPLIG